MEHLLLRFGRVKSASAFLPQLCRPLSNKVSTSGERPQMFQLEHVQKRVEFTVPLMFRERLDYTFYRKDVICEDMIFKYRAVGLDRYMSHLGMISVFSQFLFPHIEAEALNIAPVLEDGTVRLRWRVKHVSLLRILLNPLLFKRDYRVKRLRWFDGYSIFSVDGDGLVYRVTLQKMMPDDEKLIHKKTNTQRIAEKIGVLPKAAPFSDVSQKKLLQT